MSARESAIDLVKKTEWYVFRINITHDERKCDGGTASCKKLHFRDRSWEASSSNDPDVVAGWDWSHDNSYGIDCGKSGLVVVDQDPGDEWPFAGGTWTNETGRGHHFFYEDLVGLSGTTGLAPWGVDVRAVGNLVVGPGSWHPHGAYQVLSEADLGPVPPELVAALTAPGRGWDGGSDGGGYDGPAFADLTVERQAVAKAWLDSEKARWVTLLQDALDWPEGQVDERGRGWEALTRDWAWAAASWAVTDWLDLDDREAQFLFEETLPEDMARDCPGKWWDGLVAKAGERPVRQPPWAETEAAFANIIDQNWPDTPARLDDAHLVAWIAAKGLGGRCVWAGGMSWLRWDDWRWEVCFEEDIREMVRKQAIDIHTTSVQTGSSMARIRSTAALLSSGRISAVTHLMRGVVSVDPSLFDARPDLLNVGNGVVDLRTGELLAHDPSFYLSKITQVPYVAGARHPDWDKALGAFDPAVAKHLQMRVGQAITGYPTSDDVLPVFQGGGSNGKSTFVAGLFAALGEHIVKLPDKLLQAGPNDHPTELMTLRGVRAAIIDETPEAGQLNIARLKAVLGQTRMTARAVHRDNVSWDTSHSIFLFTNYTPLVAEVDRGTWRRLALFRCTRVFAPDDRFRSDLTEGAGGRAEAVLAWAVEGARRWYEAGRVLPPLPDSVQADTLEWRMDSDPIMAYMADRLVFDRATSVSVTDVFEDFNSWMMARNQKAWSDKLFSSRFSQHPQVVGHGVSKDKIHHDGRREGPVRHPDSLTDIGRSPRVWVGLRWRTEIDDSLEDLL